VALHAHQHHGMRESKISERRAEPGAERGESHGAPARTEP
jgi:hypothetical protein